MDDYFVESDGSGRIYGYGKDIAVEAGSGDITWVGLFSWQGELDDALAESNSNFAQIWQYYLVDEANGLNTGKFATGTFTSDDFLNAATGIFTYTGYGQMHEMPASQYTGYGNRNEIDFDVSLSLNMDDSSFSGVFNNVETRTRQSNVPAPDYSPVGGQFDVTNGSIVDGKLTADFSADATLLTALGATSMTGTLDGDLFGEEADQAAGTLAATSDSGGVSFGHFRASKQ